MNGIIKNKKVISFILTLALLVGIFPAFSVNIYADPVIDNDCITFFSYDDFWMRVSNIYGKNWDGIIEYSTNKAIWNEWDGSSIGSYASGGAYYLFFRGDNNTYLTKCGADYGYGWQFFCDSNVYCSGNIETLRGATGDSPASTPMALNCYHSLFQYSPVSGLNSMSIASCPDLPATQLSEGCYEEMFFNCSLITAAPVLNATTLTESCYKYMFAYCASLEIAPELKADETCTGCYLGMFTGCSSLTSAPALDASVLADSCYKEMFRACTSLITAPALDASVLCNSCYERMFEGCISLTSAPALNSNSLANGCYADMFSGCSSLINAPALPASILKDSCYAKMLSNCTSLVTAPSLDSKNLAVSCYEEMFSGCESLVSAPDLPASQLMNNCYKGMYEYCDSLISAPALDGTDLAVSCYENMFLGCESLMNPPELPATIMKDSCYNNMFAGCISLTSAPALNSTNLATSCYAYMFNGCEVLVNAPNLPATVMKSHCYDCMFVGCTSLISAPALNSMELADNCYNSMFYFCSSLENAPNLPATTLKDECYYEMFLYCTSLVNAPVINANEFAYHSCYLMFLNCTALASAPILTITTLGSACFEGMFANCSKLKAEKVLSQAEATWSIPYSSASDATDQMSYGMATGSCDIEVPSTPGEVNYYKVAVSQPVTPVYYDNTTYSVTASACSNGSVKLDRNWYYEYDNVKLAIQPDKGYKLESLSVNTYSGKEIKTTVVKEGKEYSFRMPSANVSICAVFTEDAIMQEYFNDVTVDDYYYESVLWAAQNNITNGKEAFKFYPNDTASRGQMITFIWRVKGMPMPTSTNCAFTDIVEGSYYYNAVLWALENGITNGKTDTAFDPEGVVSRAQAVCFIMRAANGSAEGLSHNFTDVEEGKYYSDAVKWAYSKGITNGTSDTTFSPDDDCLRGQIVTFLYNCFADKE